MRLEDWKFPFHVIVRPFDGFWDLKYENRGRLTIAFIFLFLLVIAQIVQQQYSGFLVNYTNFRYFNSISEIWYVLVPFFLWSIANWSITTLMDGEGRFTEIMMATGYAVLPLILVYFPTTLLSHFVTAEEVAFYYLANMLATFWCAWLLFVGTMTVHQFTPAKTIVTMLLTFVVIGIILFLILLAFSLVGQVTFFFQTIYREITFWS